LLTYNEKSYVQPSTSTADFTQRAIVIGLKNDPIQFVNMNSITPEQNNYILELGPCQPLPEDVPGKMYPKDKYGRTSITCGNTELFQMVLKLFVIGYLTL